jgi:histidinol dehydrogenase/sulfopropanediol 3-dehydrogenase
VGIRAVREGDKKAERGARDDGLYQTVREIIARVREEGEAALLEYTRRFDQVTLDTAAVDRNAVDGAYREVPPETVSALRFARDRIRAFAEKQLACLSPLHGADTIPGVELGLRLVPVEQAGCYVPAGRYPLPSSALMSVTTAKAAGVAYVAACSPPAPGRARIHPAVLVAMDIAGADKIYCMGGAQAIAAFAYGAGPVARTDLIAGPGNRYVTEAKRQVMGDVGIDSLAGPSEVLIIADETADPRWIAMDLLAQAEHDGDARSVLVSTSERIIAETLRAADVFLKELPTGETAARSWARNGAAWLADSIDDAIRFANETAPEHLELHIDPLREREAAEKLKHYGSLFVGRFAPVVLGDFVSGTNHILPTSGAARFSSGLWAGSFLKASFHQFISPEGFRALSPAAALLAETEGLAAHRASVRLREEDA